MTVLEKIYMVAFLLDENIQSSMSTIFAYRNINFWVMVVKTMSKPKCSTYFMLVKSSSFSVNQSGISRTMRTSSFK
jgi:hypothetical protein